MVAIRALRLLHTPPSRCTMYSQAFHRLVCIGSHSYPRAVPCSPRSRMHHFHHYSHNLRHSSSNLVQLPAAHRKFILLPRANQRNNSFHYHLPHSKKTRNLFMIVVRPESPFKSHFLLFRTPPARAFARIHDRLDTRGIRFLLTHKIRLLCYCFTAHTRSKKENKFLLFHSVARSRTPVE